MTAAIDIGPASGPLPTGTPPCKASAEMAAPSILPEIEAANAKYAASFGDKANLALPPSRHFALLVCMDGARDKQAGHRSPALDQAPVDLKCAWAPMQARSARGFHRLSYK